MFCLYWKKNTGNVRIIKNDILQKEPILHFDVHSPREYGLVGITYSDPFVYIYVSEAESQGGPLIANRIYKYEWDGETLKNGKLIHELPEHQFGAREHIGGQMVTGLDGDVYAVTGDSGFKGIAQNFKTGDFNDAGVILHVNLDESILKPSQSKNPQDHYLAMGIRNSFGLAIDPKTGNLWDTENGPDNFDEINLVLPKFNSGWIKIKGPASIEQIESLSTPHDFKYSDPEFSWERTVGATNLLFMNSDLFDDYKDMLLVGGFTTSTLYQFKLDSERTGFVFHDSSLQDLVLNYEDSSEELIFATGIGGPTDLDCGPDGLLYVASYFENKIYRIKPSIVSIASYDEIPNQMKNIVGGWSMGEKKDDEFISAIEFFILERLLIPSESESTRQLHESIPNWIKILAGYWADDSITNFEFIKAIEFLTKNGIIYVDFEKLKCEIKPGPEINLSGCDLSGKDFSEINLSRAKITNAILANSNLTNANLFHADLSDTDLSNAILKGVNLHGANLKNSNLHGANLVFSDLIKANLINADLSNVNLFNAKLTDAKLQNSNLKESNLKNVGFRGVNLTNADLSGSNLHNIKGSEMLANNADFSETYAFNGFFRSAELKNSLFINANLTNANFVLADLTNTNLIGADITEANFRDAKMFGCKGCPIVYTYPVLTTVDVLENGDIVLNWLLTPSDEYGFPDGGYVIYIDGENTGLKYQTDELTTTIKDLDPKSSHCFKIKARWTESGLPKRISNEICS